MDRTMLKLRDMLCDELDEQVKQGAINDGVLDRVDKITHAIKSIDTIVAMQDRGSYNSSYREKHYRDEKDVEPVNEDVLVEAIKKALGNMG